ncbi:MULTISPECIES: IPT/TIG domain-containing protein [unclassified Chitinophaga]|uniref:IPT/TIG domain-containing protein n=1 Tax=unclassified Chitinophaga TaxID=2619133 RepID=UPI0030101C13
MKTIFFFKYIPGILLLCLLFACKKDSSSADGPVIQTPLISKLSRTFVQAGDRLTIYGHALIQDGLLTEVFIGGRPGEIVGQSADSLAIIIPPKVLNGRILVTISRNQQFKSANGPEIAVKPTPLIKSYWPSYAYAGDTIALYTENFSEQNNDNFFYIGNDALQLVSKKDRDTFFVKLPANTNTGLLSWHTYDGPSDTFPVPFPIRHVSYAVNTVKDWLHLDPAFSYMDTLVRGYPVLAGGNYPDVHKRIYDSVLLYIANTNRSYTIFLPASDSYRRNNISQETFLNKIMARPYNYNTLLITAIVPGRQLQLQTLQAGDAFPTAYTMRMVYGNDYDDASGNTVSIIEQQGEKYAQLTGIYGETNPPVKILRSHQVGNATIFETDGELGIIYF